MNDKPSYYVMIQELTNLCARHNITINDIQRFTGETDGYDISLTWEQQGHDGSVCQQLPLDDIENTIIKHVPKEEPVEDEEEIEAWKKLGAKEEPVEEIDPADIPDIDGEVPCKRGELKKNDVVYYYGPDTTHKGQRCIVKKVYQEGYNTQVYFESDNCILQSSFTQLRRKV